MGAVTYVLELSEFMVMCRQERYFNLSDIQTAICEYNGKMTILPTSTKRPVNSGDMNLTPQPATISTEVIMDGRVLDENLKCMGLNAGWLQKQLEEQGYHTVKEIFLGVCDSNHTLFLFQGKKNRVLVRCHRHRV